MSIHTDASTPAVVEVSREHLAQAIRDEHEACERAAAESLRHAMRCGDLLLQAKAECQHGQWSGWLSDNFPDSARTAQVYMRLAKLREAIEAKAQGSALLSIDDAVKLLAAPRAEDGVDRLETKGAPLPDLSAGVGYVGELADGRTVQLWPSEKYPGYCYVSLVTLPEGKDGDAFVDQTIKPIRLTALLWSDLMLSVFAADGVTEWTPVFEPWVPIERWTPTWRSRHAMQGADE